MRSLPSIASLLARCAVLGAMLGSSACSATPPSAESGARAAQDSPPARFEYTETVMGVTASFTLYAESEEAARSAARAAFDRLAQLDRVMSDDEGSELSALVKRAAEGPVEVSDDLYRLLERSLEIAEATGGAFDPTAGTTVALWRTAGKTGRKPDAPALERAAGLTGRQLVKLDPVGRTVALAKRDMRLDLGGIGKGFAAQEAGRVLDEHGVRSWLVSAAGSVVAGDAPPDAPDWRVVVDSAASPDDPVRLGVRRYAVTTSGDTGEFVEIDGVRYAKLVDPRTGLLVRNRSRVTVIARDGATADALASALGVLGADAGFAILARFPDAEAIVEEMTSAGPRRRVSINEAHGMGVLR
jgi:thiamine biosynthesis lipoprotein